MFSDGHLQLLRLLSTGVCCTYFNAIEQFRNRLSWIYKTYFSAEERARLDLELEPRLYWYQPEGYIGLLAVSLVGAILTAVYLWSVR